MATRLRGRGPARGRRGHGARRRAASSCDELDDRGRPARGAPSGRRRGAAGPAPGRARARRRRVRATRARRSPSGPGVDPTSCAPAPRARRCRCPSRASRVLAERRPRGTPRRLQIAARRRAAAMTGSLEVGAGRSAMLDVAARGRRTGGVIADAFARPRRTPSTRSPSALSTAAEALQPAGRRDARATCSTLHLREQIRHASSAAASRGSRRSRRRSTVVLRRPGRLHPAGRAPRRRSELGARHRAGSSELAAEVGRAAPVRLVKMIGDAAMLVVRRTRRAARVRRSTGRGGAGRGARTTSRVLRAGVARGLGARRAAATGYGPPVNLASRITGVARPRQRPRLRARPGDAPAGEYGVQRPFAGASRA